MKTIRQWLEDKLSKDDYNKALKYSSIIWDNSLEANFYDALQKAFIWQDSTEGIIYWGKIANNNGSYIDTIVEEVRTDLLNRSQLGIKKYNTTLDRSDLSLLQWHQHQYEELLDAAVYTKKIIKELKH